MPIAVPQQREPLVNFGQIYEPRTCHATGGTLTTLCHHTFVKMSWWTHEYIGIIQKFIIKCFFFNEKNIRTHRLDLISGSEKILPVHPGSGILIYVKIPYVTLGVGDLVQRISFLAGPSRKLVGASGFVTKEPTRGSDSTYDNTIKAWIKRNKNIFPSRKLVGASGFVTKEPTRGSDST